MPGLNEAILNLSDLIDKVFGETISKTDLRDLTRQQVNYLRVIFRMGNPTLSELAKELKLTRPTVTVMVDKLVEKGYVKRIKSDNDRRSMHLHIDNKGTRISVLREIASKRLIDKIGEGLNETEINILSELLKKIAAPA